MSSLYTSAPKNTCLLRYGEWREFLLFYPILNPEIKIWKICKKHLEILSFYTCVPQMKILMYGSWCIKCKKTKTFVLKILTFYNCVPQTTIRCSNCYFSFCTIYSPFTHRQSKKSKFWKNEEKKYLEISSFYTSIPKTMIICYTIPDMAHNGCNCYFSFWAIFVLLPPNSPKNENLTQMKNILGDVIILQKCTKNHNSIHKFYFSF